MRESEHPLCNPSLQSANDRKQRRRRRQRGARSRHLAKHAGLRDVRHVDEDVVRGVTVERRTETLLVEVVADEADAAAEYEEAVERTNLQIAFS